MSSEITNWRSLGGYVSANGQKVKDDLLFRCGQLYDLNAEQIDFLQKQKKIKRVFDFRGPKEREEFPDDLWEDVDYVILDVLADAKINQASVDEVVSGNSKVDDNMLQTYEELALTKSATESYHQFLLTLVDDPVPMAFHCFAGKDRTGVGAALIFKALDVSDEQIFEDYLKTNPARKVANEEMLASLRDQLTPDELKEVEVALKVRSGYLERYFEMVKKNFGDFDHYFTEGLKLPENFKSEMQRLYLV
ncbi:tyrosine-protein phosphatase [Xylocopilactobacillus apicola]|uniref:Phosphatase n=1 Tax=Xylocopilactobacillus apicola TaxID=2932184 RepID=A0AAU9DDI0_9LACO|nr:tyrosine-protein phosphatase [Xylocopilactobacillus apicola]BDR59650.1 phosphatase [Xylocopilactobacillus apicola]